MPLLREPRVLHAADGLALGEIGTVYVAIWRLQPTPERFEIQRRYLVEAIGRHGAQASFLCIIEPAAPPPEDPVRKATTRMIENHEGVLRCVACVIEAKGFKGAVTRSVLAGMALLKGKRQVPAGFFENVEEAVAWMASHANTGDLETLVSCVATLRARLK